MIHCLVEQRDACSTLCAARVFPRILLPAGSTGVLLSDQHRFGALAAAASHLNSPPKSGSLLTLRRRKADSNSWSHPERNGKWEGAGTHQHYLARERTILGAPSPLQA